MTSTRAKLPYPVGRQKPDAELAKNVRKALPNMAFETAETTTDTDFIVQPADLLVFVTTLKERRELSFDFFRNLAGVDLIETMALKYHLYSFKHGHACQITVPTAAGHPHVPSLTPLYPTANWHEREASEMFGFVFDGHPNPGNLLLEEDLHIHPLLKAHPLQAAEILQGLEDREPGFKF